MIGIPEDHGRCDLKKMLSFDGGFPYTKKPFVGQHIWHITSYVWLIPSNIWVTLKVKWTILPIIVIVHNYPRAGILFLGEPAWSPAIPMWTLARWCGFDPWPNDRSSYQTIHLLYTKNRLIYISTIYNLRFFKKNRLIHLSIYLSVCLSTIYLSNLIESRLI